MPQAVIWDWNGTLLDDLAACVAALNDLLRTRGMPLVSPDEHTKRFLFPVRDYYAALGFDFSRESFPQIAVEYHQAYDRRWEGIRLRGDAHEAFDTLDRARIKQHLLSASEQGRLMEQLDRFGIRDRFASVSGLDDLHADGKVGRGRDLVKEQKLTAQSTWMIGDTLHDVEVAAELGVEPILVTGGHQHEQTLRSTGVRVVESLSAAAELIVDRLRQPPRSTNADQG